MGSESVTTEKALFPRRNVWADYFFRPLLLTGMVTCLSISIIALGRSLGPTWWGGQLFIGMILVTVETIYSFRLLAHPRSRNISRLRYRLAEWGTLAIALKVITYLGQPWAEIWAGVETFLRQPGAFFSLDYALMLALGLATWGATHGTMVDFEALYDPYTFRSREISPLNKLALRFFWGGGALIIISGLTLLISEAGVEAGLVNMLDVSRPGIDKVALNVLVYFVLGLIMLSQVRLTTLLTRWHIQKVHVAGGLGKAWAKYGLIFLGLVSLLILFLPTGYSVGVFESVRYLFGFLVQLVLFLFQLLLLLIAIPITFLANLLGAEATWGQNGVGTSLPPQLPPATGRRAPPWGEVVRSLLFWLTFTFIALYLIKSYLADHPELLDSLKRFKPLGWLFGLFATLVVWLIQFIQAGIKLLPRQNNAKSKPQETTPVKKQRRRPRLRGASHRDRILYYYLNTLQRAKAVGLVRKKYQTPYEFEPHLSRSLPEVESEVDLLTKAFVHARYSRDTFDGEHAALVKTVWKRIRSSLRVAGKHKP